MKTNIIPEETLIYKELKSKFEFSDPELWKEVEGNLKQVLTEGKEFYDKRRLSYCFNWSDTNKGHSYWDDIARKLNGGKDWW